MRKAFFDIAFVGFIISCIAYSVGYLAISGYSFAISTFSILIYVVWTVSKYGSKVTPGPGLFE